MKQDNGVRAGHSAKPEPASRLGQKASVPDAVDYSQLIVKPYIVTTNGYGEDTYYARSRGRALADAWQSSLVCNNWSFGEFLKQSNAYSGVGHPQYGEPITVCGKPAFIVSANKQYIRFVRPGSDVVMSTHPLDVEPPEARRMTPYRAQAIEARRAETGEDTGSVADESAVRQDAPGDNP